MADELNIAYDKSDLARVKSSFKAMDAEAIAQARVIGNRLATYLQGKIIQAAGRTQNRADDRIAQGSVVSKSSKIGELSFGFQRQKFSGGGTTQQLWGGYEFGSINNKFKQFPGRSKGWFIYPTLRVEQSHIINEWENAFTKILKEW